MVRSPAASVPPSRSGGRPGGATGSGAVERIAATRPPRLHARARRSQGDGRRRRAAVPRRHLVGPRRLPRRRRLLRPQRLPDHEPAARRMARRRADRVVGVLGPPGAAAASRAVPRPRGRRGVWRGDRGAGRARASAQRRPLCPRLCRQLGPDLLAPVVLRVVRGAVASAAHLVAGDRGAVLPGVAVARRGRAAVAARLDSVTRRGDGRAAGGVGGVDDRPLQAGRRPDARLLRDRHTRAVVAYGRAARNVADARAPAAGCERDAHTP